MAASLKCSERLADTKEESTIDCVFFFDQNIQKGPRSGLLDGRRPGESYLPNPSYALSVQNCATFCKYREQTYMWMLGVCRDKGSSANVAYVGINYFDRYLSCKVIPRRKLELLSWFCLHLASLYYDNRTNNLSYKEISSVISDTYSPQEIQSFLFDLLSVLDFRLSPYSPYTDGETILCKAGHSSLYSNYQSLLNGVCMKYESLQVPPVAITHTCILLAWSFSFPEKKLDGPLEFCGGVCEKDKEMVVSLVRELFPMMRDTCDGVLARRGEKAQYYGISPISMTT